MDLIPESFENYLRTKFLDFENNSQIDKKLKSYKKVEVKQSTVVEKIINNQTVICLFSFVFTN